MLLGVGCLVIIKKRGKLMKDFRSETITLAHPNTYGELSSEYKNLNNTHLTKEDEFSNK